MVRPRAAVAAIATLAGLGSCRERDVYRELPPAVSSASSRPVALLAATTPELIAGFRVAQPEFTYGALRGLSARPLPQSLQVLLPSLVGLNPALSGRFTTGHDWLGAVTAEAGGALAWAVGVPVVSGRELVAELSLGAEAPLRAQPRLGWIELTGSSGGVLGPLSLGVSGNYLVVGSSPTAVRSLAPWLVHPAGTSAIAPEQTETGVSFRLFASGLALQALHAHLRESWSIKSSPWSQAIEGTIAGSRAADVEALMNDGVSAYLAAIEGGEAHVRWQGQKVSLGGEFRGHVPLRGDPRLCREITGLPTDVRFWVAGVSGVTVGETSSSVKTPDWEPTAGAWQGALLNGLGAVAASFDGRVRVNSDIEFADGPWVVGWRERAGASTALAVLSGVPFAAIETTPVLPPTKAGSRVQTKTTDGKVLEWAWAPRDAGIVTAFGAHLGPQWDTWVQKPLGTGWPNGLSPRSCDGLIFAAGTNQGAALSVSRSDAGIHVQGELDLSTLGGLLR
jgi:hypothetical protein